MHPESVFGSCEVLLGTPAVFDARPFRPFDDEVVSLLEMISSSLMADDAARKYPDVMSFAFWCRRGHIASLREQYGDRISARLGRGLVLHIAPSNVPVNFAFSWAFSLLAGNSNIVRVPSKDFPQVSVILDVLDKCLKDVADKRNAFVRYSSQSHITEDLSSVVDARVIWGGDTTVKLIKSYEAKPRCVDVAFPDRYSVAFLNGQAISSLSDQELSNLTSGFYNDTYLMDQNACSSARVVFWVDDDQDGKARFWDALKRKVRRDYGLQPAVATEKYVQLCRDVIDEIVSEHVEFNGYLEVLQLPNGIRSFEELRGSGGYFYECDVQDIGRVLNAFGQKCQTVTYFGMDPQQIRDDVIENGCAGVDRVVPVGSALDIDIVWDGYDLVETLSREITTR